MLGRRLAIPSFVLALAAYGGGCNGPPRVQLADQSYPADADWEGLPPHVRDRLKAQNTKLNGSGADRPPYPIGGMQAIMRRVEYTRLARRRGAEGRVVVVARVDQHGHVQTVHVVSPVHPELDRAALAAVRESTFHPATKDGRPVEASVAIPFEFQLEPGS